MKVAQIRTNDPANGLGLRVSLFLSGCTHRCKGCFNEEYQDFNYGEKLSKKHIDQLVDFLSDENISGLTVLGGEPLQQNLLHLHGILLLLKKITQKTIWVYTGYTFEEILKNKKMREFIEVADVLVDGPFIEEKKDLTLTFRGSSNQRILDVKKSLLEKKAVLFSL